MLSIEVAKLGKFFANKFDPSEIKCCLCCFSCCLKMHGQVERKSWLHFATGMGAY